MNYQESLDYVKSLVPTLERPSLSRVEQFFAELNAPQAQLPCFHVGGTNGKGSVSTLLASMLQALGYKCGKFTGPHLLSFNERFVINGEAISADDFSRVASSVRDLSEQFASRHQELGHLTWFEFLTAMAVQYFATEKVDYSVFEVGMGGRFDATNILNSVLATVITNVDLDHMQFLGDTREKIAFEKSGILKAGVPVVTTCDGGPLTVILERAAELGCPVYALRGLEYSAQTSWRDFSIEYLTPELEGHNVIKFVAMLKEELQAGASFDSGLSGAYQRTNVLTALVALAASGLLTERLASPESRESTIELLKQGLSRASWPGRFEIIEQPRLILDGAHNPHGARALRASLLEKFGPVNFVFLLTCFENKDARELLGALLAPGDQVLAFDVTSERKMHSAEALVQIAENLGASGTVVCDCARAIQVGEEIVSRQNKSYADYLIAAGSFVTVREASLQAKLKFTV